MIERLRAYKVDLSIFVILSGIVIFLQHIILSPHLRYAFADVDWSFLLSFKELSNHYHDPISHLLGAWRAWGVYTYQVYYIGLIEKFFGMDYRNFQQVTHFFKLISTLSLYPLIRTVTNRRLVAFLTTVIYAVSYSSVGVMYTVVTSGLFVAIPVMCIFLWWYYNLIKKGSNSLLDISTAVVLFFLTLFLATERMYPLVPTLILIEFYWWFKNNYSSKVLKQIVKRLGAFLAIFAFVLLLRPTIFTSFFGNTHDTYTRFLQGNWQVLMSPVISFGSLFLPRDYWKFLGGIPNIDNISSYISFVIWGPMLTLSVVTVFLSIFLSKNRKRFILNTLILTLLSSLAVYILSSHQLYIPELGKMHFDIATIPPAILGFYVISLNIVLLKQWKNEGMKDNLIISMIGALTISMIFIVLTWIAADYVLVFTGIHRYLTIPAIGSSFFMAGIITIIFNRLYNLKSAKFMSYLFILILIPFIVFNYNVITTYFNYELTYAGTDADGHIRMKNKLWSYLGNISNAEPSIFYFDESKDHDNDYFDETTVMAGFNYWMRFRGSKLVDAKLTPALLRSNLICNEERSMCLSKVRELVAERNDEKGILYGGIFYKKDNFYAFRFINKDILDIKPEITKVIGLD